MKQRKETPKSSDLPIYLFKQGNNQEAYRYFGAHLCEENGGAGAVFRVWAPHAKAVSIVGDFNSWTPGEHPMEKVTDGIWERFVPGIKQFDVYKYCITTPADELVYKADPYAFHTETRPSNGRSMILRATPGGMPPGSVTRKSGMSSTARCPFTSCRPAAGR